MFMAGFNFSVMLASRQCGSVYHQCENSPLSHLRCLAGAKLAVRSELASLAGSQKQSQKAESESS